MFSKKPTIDFGNRTIHLENGGREILVERFDGDISNLKLYVQDEKGTTELYPCPNPIVSSVGPVDARSGGGGPRWMSTTQDDYPMPDFSKCTPLARDLAERLMRQNKLVKYHSTIKGVSHPSLRPGDILYYKKNDTFYKCIFIANMSGFNSPVRRIQVAFEQYPPSSETYTVTDYDIYYMPEDWPPQAKIQGTPTFDGEGVSEIIPTPLRYIEMLRELERYGKGGKKSRKSRKSKKSKKSKKSRKSRK